MPRGMGGLGQEGGGLAEVVIGFEAGALRDQLVEDAPAEVELPGLGVVALLGVEGEGQQVVDVAGEETGAVGVIGGLGVSRELARVEPLDVPVEGQAEEALVEAGWQPCRGHGTGGYRVPRGQRLGGRCGAGAYPCWRAIPGISPSDGPDSARFGVTLTSRRGPAGACSRGCDCPEEAGPTGGNGNWRSALTHTSVCMTGLSPSWTLRAMLESASRYRPDVVPGRWVVETRFRRRPWEVIVEPDDSLELLVVVTAFPA